MKMNDNNDTSVRKTNLQNTFATMVDSEPDISKDVARFILNYVVRFFTTVIVVYCCWIPFQNLGGWFSYHVILCTFGYIPLMAEAIMLFVGDDIWSRNLSRKAKYAVHGILITVGTVFVIVGNALVFHYIQPGYHLCTAHGITGLISMLFLIISLVLGLAVNYPDHAKKIISLRPIWFKLSHNVLGLLGYAVGIISLCYAYFTNWFMYYNGEESRWTAFIITIFISLWPLNGAFVSAYHQIKTVLS